MVPTFDDGDELLVSGWLGIGRGDVAVVEHPGQLGLFIIKRVTDVRHEGGRRQVWLEGDNPDMSKTDDSWRFGWVDVDRVRGRVVGRVRQRRADVDRG